MQAGLTRISLSNAPQTGATQQYKYGSFSSSAIQSIAAPNVAQKVEFPNANSFISADGISVAGVGGTDIVFDKAGYYSLDFELQVANTSNQEQEFYVALYYAGFGQFPLSTRVVTIPRQTFFGHGHHVICLNYFVNVDTDGDNYYLMIAATSTLCKLETVAIPAFSTTPSASVNVSSFWVF